MKQILNIDRPLMILDFETTGLNPTTERVVQMASKMIYPGERESVSFVSYINPGIEFDNHHGITSEHTKDAPFFSDMAEQLARVLKNTDICGYNVRFDIGFLRAEMERSGVFFDWDNHIIDPFILFGERKGNNLSACYLKYGGDRGTSLPADTDLSSAHDAAFDIHMTEASLVGILYQTPSLSRDVPELAKFCFPRKDVAIDKFGKLIWAGKDAALNFGKHRGRYLREAEEDRGLEGYLDWIVMKSGMSDEIKDILTDALDGRYPVRD